LQVPLFRSEDDLTRRKISSSEVLADKQQQAKESQTLGSQIVPLLSYFACRCHILDNVPGHVEKCQMIFIQNIQSVKFCHASFFFSFS
jgi:hypothetical protein